MAIVDPGTGKQIWDSLMSYIGNAYGAAGMMGNMWAESGWRPNNLQNSFEQAWGVTDESYTQMVDDGTWRKGGYQNAGDSFSYDSGGYGLVQWTWSKRKKQLYSMKRNYSIGSIVLQLDYLKFELTTAGWYKSTGDAMIAATSIREASNYVLHVFENPKDQGPSVEEYRFGLSQEAYNMFSGTEPGPPPVDPDPYPPVDPDQPDPGPKPEPDPNPEILKLWPAMQYGKKPYDNVVISAVTSNPGLINWQWDFSLLKRIAVIDGNAVFQVLPDAAGQVVYVTAYLPDADFGATAGIDCTGGPWGSGYGSNLIYWQKRRRNIYKIFRK